MKDESGDRVQIADIHREWFNFIEDNIAQGRKRIGILAPRDHGKTTNIVIPLPLYWLYKNPNYRIKIVCNRDMDAMKRVGVLQQYIEQDPDYKALCGDVVIPAKDVQWTGHSFFIQRTSKSIDASVESTGIMTTGVGGRADILIVDDPCDMKNSLISAVEREKVKDTFNNVWVNVLEPHGIIIYIATAWHQEDLTHMLLANPEWTFLIQRVAYDFSCIEQVITNPIQMAA